MNTRVTLSEGSWKQLNKRQTAGAGILFLLILLLTLPFVAQAQFTYTVSNGQVTITGYAGLGGALTIPSTIANLPVTGFASLAFYNCTSLTSVTIPDSITSIGGAAFGGCTGLTNVAFPDSITELGGQAFGGCTSLASVTIPSSVTFLGTDTFVDCTRLTSIVVDDLNPVFTSVAGVVFDKSLTTLVMCPAGRAGGYTIPSSATRIGSEAFQSCSSLASVTIPNSVTNIGNVPFGGCTSLTSVTIPNSVTSIGVYLFSDCSSLTNVTIPNSVTNALTGTFYGCTKLTSVTIPNSVTIIGSQAFAKCTCLTRITIPDSVTDLQDFAFWNCTNLTSVYFQGNAPSLAPDAFLGANNATVYYMPGTTGWGTTFDGRPAVLWSPATLLTSPQTQTAEAMSAVGLRVEASGSWPLFYLWYLNETNLISCSTNHELNMPNVLNSQSGAYTVVVSNAFGAVTSAPTMLNVIAPVQRRPVPGVKVTGQTATMLDVEYSDSLSSAPTWTMLGSVSLTGTPEYCFDLTLPLPSQRFYRAWQTGTPGVTPSLDLHLVPAITLTGNIGHSVRLDYINRFGPIDAWVTLATMPLTNTSQLYFDISAPGQPQRFYRLVP